MQITNSKYFIQQRQEGENVLSWIENFGLYLINDKTNRRFAFEKEDHILVLRIQNDGKEDIISAYYCYFRTSNNGVARFCINSPFDGTEIATKELWNLMVEKAQWNSTQTRKWWEFVFPVGQTVDESILKQKLVVASELTDITMSEFVSSIAAEFEKVIRHLGIIKDKYTKICIVGQYAMALPVLHALRNLFPNRQVNSYVFTKNNPMKEYSWKQNASRFHVPSKLLYTTLNTTVQMTVEDVLDLGENGIFVTLPLSKCEDGNYHLPSTPIFKGFDLKWNELEKDKVEPNYIVGELLFKRLELTFFTDGFQILYIMCNHDVVACSKFEKNKYVIGQLSSHKLEESNEIASGLEQRKKGKSAQQTNKGKESSFTNPKSSVTTIKEQTSTKGAVYVIDTNVFLDYPNILDIVPANYKIGLTPKIVDEIDGNKNKSEDLKRKAIQAQKSIYHVSEKGNRIIYEEPNLNLLKGLNGAKPDNKILALALTLKKEGYEPTILTSDYGLLTSASLNKVSTQKLSELIKQKR